MNWWNLLKWLAPHDGDWRWGGQLMPTYPRDCECRCRFVEDIRTMCPQSLLDQLPADPGSQPVKEKL